MNREQLSKAARWNAVVKAIEMYRKYENTPALYSFHDVFRCIGGEDVQSEILEMVEQRAKERMAEQGVCESLHGAPLETIEAHRVEVRLGIRLQYAEKKIRELEIRLDEQKKEAIVKKWWSV